MWEWWMYQLNVTDRTNIICFVIVILISVVCIAIARKMKLPIWMFQIGWVLLMDLIGVALLISRLNHG